MNKDNNKNDSGIVLDYVEQCKMIFDELYSTYCIGANKGNIPDIIDSFWNDIYIQVFKPDRTLVNNLKTKLVYSDIETMEAVTRLYINLCRRYGGVVKINTFCEFTGLNRERLNTWYNAKHISPYIVTLNTKEIETEKENIIFIHDSMLEKNGHNINNNSNHYDITNGVDNTLDNNIYNNILGNDNNSPINKSYIDKASGKLAFLRYDCKKLLVESMQGSTRNGLTNSPVGHMARANNDEELAMLWDAKRKLNDAVINGRATLTASELPQLAPTNNARLIDNANNSVTDVE